MGFSAFSPTYIYQTPSGYIFRLRVPADIKPVVGRSEFRYSLRSGALRVAKHRARCIASLIQQLFEKVRERMTEYTPERILELVKRGVGDVIYDAAGVEVFTQIAINGKTALEPSYLQKSNGRILLPPERIKQLVIQYTMEALETDEKCRALIGSTSNGTVSIEGLTILEASNMKADEAQAILQSVTRWISQGDHSLMHSLTDKILTLENVNIDPQSETYKVLSRELLKAYQSVLQVRINLKIG